LVQNKMKTKLQTPSCAPLASLLVLPRPPSDLATPQC
jgi:hypothetical protein